MNPELIRAYNALQAQVDGLVKPEVALGWSLIAETVLSGSVASVTFSSIPQGFRHLAIFSHSRDSIAAEGQSLSVQFNGDTGANYNFIQLVGNSATASASTTRATANFAMGLSEAANSQANLFARTLFFVPEYKLSSVERVIFALAGSFGDESADTDLLMVFRFGHWNSTSAITSITLASPGDNLVSGSQYQLYGIK